VSRGPCKLPARIRPAIFFLFPARTCFPANRAADTPPREKNLPGAPRRTATYGRTEKRPWVGNSIQVTVAWARSLDYAVPCIFLLPLPSDCWLCPLIGRLAEHAFGPCLRFVMRLAIDYKTGSRSLRQLESPGLPDKNKKEGYKEEKKRPQVARGGLGVVGQEGLATTNRTTVRLFSYPHTSVFRENRGLASSPRTRFILARLTCRRRPEGLLRGWLGLTGLKNRGDQNPPGRTVGWVLHDPSTSTNLPLDHLAVIRARGTLRPSSCQSPPAERRPFVLLCPCPNRPRIFRFAYVRAAHPRPNFSNAPPPSTVPAGALSEPEFTPGLGSFAEPYPRRFHPAIWPRRGRPGPIQGPRAHRPYGLPTPAEGIDA